MGYLLMRDVYVIAAGIEYHQKKKLKEYKNLRPKQ